MISAHEQKQLIHQVSQAAQILKKDFGATRVFSNALSGLKIAPQNLF